jgi:hypothetical protein
MDEAWYIVEQQIRERHTEAREVARIRALTHDRASTARRMSSVRTAILRRLAKWALGSRNARNPSESEREKGHHHAPRGYPNADWTRPPT